MFVVALRRFRRCLFTYLSCKTVLSGFYVFCCGLFGLTLFCANWLRFQLFRNIFRLVLLIFSFSSCASRQRAQLAQLHCRE